MNLEGFILEDLWWKNQGDWSWDGGDMDFPSSSEKTRMEKHLEIISGILGSGKGVEEFV